MAILSFGVLRDILNSILSLLLVGVCEVIHSLWSLKENMNEPHFIAQLIFLEMWAR